VQGSEKKQMLSNAKKGLIADIQRASLHDGDGIRTTVFFKGCPLKCAWCHNPECISFEPEMMHYPEKCIGCGMCEEGCFSGAKVICGTEMTATELFLQIRQDKDYFMQNGGVTFSGGEPMAQKEFLLQILDLCRAEGISCAIETSMIYFDAEIFQKLDFVMADFKIWDTKIHQEYTGMGNEKIKDNFMSLNQLNIPIIVRTPVIPGIEQEIPKISAFLKTLDSVKRYELLPYHPLGKQKRDALGITQEAFSVPDKEYLKELQQYAYIR